MTANDLLTRKDLEEFKKELFELLAPLKATQSLTTQKWLKNKDVKQLLHISNGTLQNLRTNGTLPFKKIGSIYYYKQEDINKMLAAPEKKARKGKLSASPEAHLQHSLLSQAWRQAQKSRDTDLHPRHRQWLP